MDRPEFCSAFDEHLALAGPPAIFIRTLEEQWRVEPDLSRDGYERARLRGEPVPPLSPAVHVLARDTRTGFVSRFLVTAPALFADHLRHIRRRRLRPRRGGGRSAGARCVQRSLD